MLRNARRNSTLCQLTLAIGVLDGCSGTPSVTCDANAVAGATASPCAKGGSSASVASGGGNASGGALATGGTVATGGAVSGGAAGTGGAQETGGAQNTGGAIGIGGSDASGGSDVNSGGASATGGTFSTGGSATGGSATGGASDAQICVPSEKKCVKDGLPAAADALGAVPSTCSEDGLSWISGTPCLESEYCASAACHPMICTPGAAFCETIGMMMFASVCNANGSTHLPNPTNCTSQHMGCTAGVCTDPVFYEPFTSLGFTLGIHDTKNYPNGWTGYNDIATHGGGELDIYHWYSDSYHGDKMYIGLSHLIANSQPTYVSFSMACDEGDGACLTEFGGDAMIARVRITPNGSNQTATIDGQPNMGISSKANQLLGFAFVIHWDTQTYDYGSWTNVPFAGPATKFGYIDLFPYTRFGRTPQNGTWDEVLIY